MAVRVSVHVGDGARPVLKPVFGPRLKGLPALVRSGARAALDRDHVQTATLEITLVDDATISDLHQRYLGRRGPTDVMSFALHDDEGPPEADIYICAAQAVRQA
jgi:ssRNA-specific RNase YbeY (16S rRNA maturation enzyme)